MSKPMDLVIGGIDFSSYQLKKDTMAQVYIREARWTSPLTPGESRWISVEAIEPLGDKIKWCEGCEKLFLKEEINKDYCESCYEHHFCECGNCMEEYAGEGFCPSCR